MPKIWSRLELPAVDLMVNTIGATLSSEPSVEFPRCFGVSIRVLSPHAIQSRCARAPLQSVVACWPFQCLSRLCVRPSFFEMCTALLSWPEVMPPTLSALCEFALAKGGLNSDDACFEIGCFLRASSMQKRREGPCTSAQHLPRSFYFSSS